MACIITTTPDQCTVGNRFRARRRRLPTQPDQWCHEPANTPTPTPPQNYQIKPASPALQTGDTLYASLHNCWLFQGDGTDLKGNNNFTINNTGGVSITFPTVGDDGQVCDRNSDANGRNLTCSPITSTTKFSIALRLYLRATTSFGTLLSVSGGNGLYSTTDPDGFKLLYYPASNQSNAITKNAWHDIVFTFDTPNWKTYVDGVLNKSGTTSFISSAWTSSLSDPLSERIDGQIAQMLVWLGRELTLAEANDLHTARYRLVTPPA